ncbi:formylglycine-generating enzyme [Achroia grisella]|uniref:formylglycine-generating enzyme n=1 Tax=Achroia grisella TaxID=688607 RepID=UPI0027D266B6|nr:formylglycine-generating enzyme [Achroia grisella]
MLLWFLFSFSLFNKSVYNAEDISCGCGDINRNIYKNIFVSKRTIDSTEQCTLKSEMVTNEFQSTPENDMVLVSGGEYQFGTDDIIIETDKEGPSRIVKINSFYLDKYEVSNIDFYHFAKSTNYKTEAETFGDSFVFALFLNRTFREELKDFRVGQAPWWYKIDGADWNHPHGPDSNIKDIMNHPVIHVSWRDAVAYCLWRNARLPTEAEWEAACRGGHRNTKYPWGDKLFPDKKYMANIWQGNFPNHNSAKDGYIGTSPVKSFLANDFGFYNMAGNVWEWTQDSWSKDQPEEKVKKGGSYLCHRSYCYRYRCSARSHNTEDSSAGNLGFRCAKSL